MLLVCSSRCGGSLFRALFAEVDVDAGGAYLDHQVLQANYMCLGCGSPALDLGAVPVEIQAEREADLPETLDEILCPVCESLVEVGANRECPDCGAYLAEVDA